MLLTQAALPGEQAMLAPIITQQDVVLVAAAAVVVVAVVVAVGCRKDWGACSRPASADVVVEFAFVGAATVPPEAEAVGSLGVVFDNEARVALAMEAGEIDPGRLVRGAAALSETAAAAALQTRAAGLLMPCLLLCSPHHHSGPAACSSATCRPISSFQCQM